MRAKCFIHCLEDVPCTKTVEPSSQACGFADLKSLVGLRIRPTVTTWHWGGYTSSSFLYFFLNYFIYVIKSHVFFFPKPFYSIFGLKCFKTITIKRNVAGISVC